MLKTFDIECQVIGLDATHNVTCRKNVFLFAIIGRCQSGAFPLSYFITTSKEESAIVLGLTMFRCQITQVLQRYNLLGLEQVFEPDAFCIDMDAASNNAIRRIFPGSIIVLCHYHFMVNIVNQVRNNKHEIPGNIVPTLMSTIRTLAASRTISDFSQTLEKVKRISESFFKYINDYYLTEQWIDTFSEVNRTMLPLSTQRLCRSNMLTEVSFRTLKYIVLDGYMNKRLDSLLYAIAYRMFPYYLVRSNKSSVEPPRFLIKLDVKERGSLMYR
tara:strand:- start:408 stop:1223 length:816 start_codon:yes stop_codon:yes gene_type:complete